MEQRTPEEFRKLIQQIECEPLKESYLHARALADQPQNSLLFQLYADFLVDRPDEDGSWDLAENFYKSACDLVRKQRAEPYHSAFILFRYAYFLARNRRRYKEANSHYLELFRLLPPNAWTVERYAVFLSEHRHQHDGANLVFQHLAHVAPTGSSLSSFAFFKWQIKRQIREANDLFRTACDLEREKIYFLVNFIARQTKDRQLASQLIRESALMRHLQESPDADSIFAMALTYHQVPLAEEAETYYRRHLALTPKPNVYALSNLAELLLHSCQRIDEAQNLYEQALQRARGHNETVEVALVGVRLVKGEREAGLKALDELINSSYIQASKNTYTEAAILRYIHCFESQKAEALALVKRLLVTEEVRPKLILMFDANLAWAKANNCPDFNLMKAITAVYNCEEFVEVLDVFPEWASIQVPPPTPDLD